MPVLEPRLPPSQWQLSEQGRRLSRALADELLNYDPITIFASQETKALATAEEIARVLKLPVLVVLDLHEHERMTTDWMDTEEIFCTNVKKFFDFPDAQIFGCETANQSLKRFETAILNLLSKHTSQDIGIVSHGTVILLLVSKWIEIPAFSLWQRLKLPDIVLLTS